MSLYPDNVAKFVLAFTPLSPYFDSGMAFMDMSDSVINAETVCLSRVLDKRTVADRAYVLRFERRGLEFRPGQHILVGLPGTRDMREYSVYSAPDDGYLEILFREVEHGLVSRQLTSLAPGDTVRVEGPHGEFIVEDADLGARFLFIATGTGIAPFHCFVRSYPGLQYLLLHGVRTVSDCFDRERYAPDRYVGCTTGDPEGHYLGRVTSWLLDHPVEPGTLCYLCGNSDMIFEAHAILTARGVPRDRIFAEVYF